MAKLSPKSPDLTSENSMRECLFFTPSWMLLVFYIFANLTEKNRFFFFKFSFP